MPPLHLAMGHSLPCMEKGHSPLCTIKGSVSSTHGIGKLSRLYRQDIPSFVKRRDLPPRLIAEGHTLLYVENTLAPLYKEGGWDILSFVYRKQHYAKVGNTLETNIAHRNWQVADKNGKHIKES